MTTHTRYNVKCSCGHTGEIRMSENDQPFSAQWEKYRLEDLEGEESYYVEGFAKWPDVFNALKPVCPKCKNSLLPSNLV